MNKIKNYAPIFIKQQNIAAILSAFPDKSSRKSDNLSNFHVIFTQIIHWHASC